MFYFGFSTENRKHLIQFVQQEKINCRHKKHFHRLLIDAQYLIIFGISSNQNQLSYRIENSLNKMIYEFGQSYFVYEKMDFLRSMTTNITNCRHSLEDKRRFCFIYSWKFLCDTYFHSILLDMIANKWPNRQHANGPVHTLNMNLVRHQHMFHTFHDMANRHHFDLENYAVDIDWRTYCNNQTKREAINCKMK